MTHKVRTQVQEIVDHALELKDPHERERYLAQACGQDAGLRQQVNESVTAQSRPGEPLGPTVLEPESHIGEGPGTVIGRYKLLQQIGEGGFGLVFMAEQLEPVQRKVALKIIKAGMDTREVIARFEAERQALALMDHPNIARVLDGGATESGRPYFVMELVKGVKITTYCDQNNLSTEERLQLFIKVCHALQQAHQKGIIHRDLKPSNVMVTLHDQEAIPKIIDFGIAKATGYRLTEKTLFTRYEQMIGTPAYMSPEQAQMSGLDVDTRTDIYALGVLLYELLTGVTPFDKQTLAQAAFDEVRRIIQETEPLKPSTRLHGLGEQGTEVAKQRHTDPGALRRTLRGDLDWIAMKALEKDRRRRYETANDFAEDIERHLAHQPVLASPPSTLYRARKFVRRHRVGVAMATGITLAIVAGVSLALVALQRALQAEAATSRERDRALVAEQQIRRERDRAIQAEADTQGMLALFSDKLVGNDERMALRYSAVRLARERLGPSNSAALNFILPLARSLGRLGAWTNALEVYGWVNDAAPENCDLWTRTHAAALAAAQPEAGRQCLEKIVKRFGGTIDALTAMQVGRAVLIRPDYQEHLQTGLDCANRAIRAQPKNAWCQLVQGMAEYRRGNGSEALKSFQKPECNQDKTVAAIAWCFEAMVWQQAGQTAAAREALDRASRQLHRSLATGVLSPDYWDLVVFGFVACAEAERFVLGREVSPPVTAGFMAEAREKWKFVLDNLARGEELAREKKWAESWNAYVQAFQHPSFHWAAAEDQSTWACLSLHMANVFVRAGDSTNYERLCRLLLAQGVDKPGAFDSQQEAGSKAERYAKACCLKPQSLAPELQKAALELSRFGLAYSNYNVGWALQSGGMAEYYFGQPEKALGLLQRAEQDQDVLIAGIAKLYRAMTLQKLNRPTEAADALLGAEKIFIQVFEKPSGFPWWDLMQIELALPEARQLIHANAK